MSDAYVIGGRLWIPSALRTSTAIVYLHGIQSHGGWYEWSASRMASFGHIVMMPDRRGSGLNATARGDVASASRWLDDLTEHVMWLRTTHAVKRVAIVGVSWGGKLACAWTLSNPTILDALLLIAPGIFPAVDLPTLRKIRVGLSLLTDGSREFEIPLTDPRLFTHSKSGQQFIAEDMLKLERVSGRFLFESSRLDRQVVRAPHRAIGAASAMLLASDDLIIRNVPTERWLRSTCRDDPRIETVLGGSHTLEFGDEVGQFDRFIADWAASLAEPQMKSQ